MDETAWHNDSMARTAKGQAAEILFDETWICYCGGLFVKNDSIIHYSPDRKCSLCGQFVDIKSSDLHSGAIAISQIPFEKYSPKLVVAVWGGEYWLGSLRENCQIKGGVHPAAHKEQGTPFYLISLDNFRLLEFFLHRKLEAGTPLLGLER